MKPSKVPMEVETEAPDANMAEPGTLEKCLNLNWTRSEMMVLLDAKRALLKDLNYGMLMR